jgi:gliding motility-associated-like protein
MSRRKYYLFGLLFFLAYTQPGHARVITTVAGTGLMEFSDDGGLAINATLRNVAGIDAGTPALTAMLSTINGLSVNTQDSLCFSDGAGNRIREMSNIAPVACTPSIVIAASALSVCYGSPVTFTASVVNGGTAPLFEWRQNGQVVGSDSTFTAVKIYDQDVVECVLTSNAACAINPVIASNSIVMIVNTVADPSLTIFTNSPTVCAGSLVRFSTGAAIYPGNTPFFQWKINQVNVGVSNSVFLTANLNNGDIVTCEMTTSYVCTIARTVTSNALSMTVNPLILISPSVSITANAITACEGTAINFTASPVNGGPSPHYAWNVNGAAIANSNAGTFSSSGLKDKDTVTCTITNNTNCLANASGLSNQIIAAIVPLPAIAIQASAINVCSETMIDFLATSFNSGSVPGYQWQINGTNFGTGSDTYSTSKLKHGDKVKCILTANTLCNAPVASNEISLAVNELPIVKIDSVQIIVRGHSVQFNPTASSNVTGYQWTPTTGLSMGNISDPIASPTTTLVYKLVVSTLSGCEASADVKVIVLQPVNAPNVFSPNGDGVNDTWQIPGLTSYPGCTVEIYNRGGQLIYHSVGYDIPWDGSFNGKNVPAGTYYYVINLKNGFGQQAGSVTVIK